ncbi:hypothetical protein EST38_g5297 [Candolleomyces aberdarensis]|uniref:Asparagine--tRNA ligase, mitochondrial n=1 Tax=Candolleomyces aberdarensis TaxID=2316362 RepID=A0A4Q2DP11_9AGAR|nr:hypothetical protein EST38_g5297 [Candolleomyces aberdarensis]
MLHRSHEHILSESDDERMLSRYLLRPSILRAPHSSPSGYRLPPTISQLLSSTNAPVNTDTTTTVSGWIKSIRKQKNVSFAVVTDGSSDQGLQAVLLKNKGQDEEDSVLKKLTNGAAVRLTGKLVKSPGSGQSHELVVDEKQPDSIVVLGECDPETYPIQKKALTNEYLRDNAHLRARTSQIAAMLRLRDNLTHRIGSWFSSQGFVAANTPILTGNDAEGAGEAFRLALMDLAHPAAESPSPTPSEEFFSHPAFLTVSHQLHLEALATALSRVYTLSPCFRAEPSATRRHLAEFWMLEAEWAFLEQGNDVRGVCRFVEAMLRNVAGSLVTNDSDMECLWRGNPNSGNLESLQKTFGQKDWWTCMTYTEAVKELEGAGVKFEYAPKWGKALQSEHERWLAETLVKGPVFVTDYPVDLKPFYMRLNDDGKTVACFDLLVPHIGELVGGSVREERFDILRENMSKAGLVEGGAYQWYEDLRKYGGAPHAGFGMGFERLIGWVGGIENIRECVPMPRWSGRLLL